MNFNGWKEIKKLFSYTKEIREAIFGQNTEDESNEGKHVKTNVQLTDPPTNSTTIEEDPMNEHQVASTIISDQTSYKDADRSRLKKRP